MKATAKGVIKKIIQKNESDKFPKSVIVIEEVDGQYTNDVAIEFGGKVIDAPSKFAEGQSVTIECNVRSKEYNGKYFTNVSGWKIAADGVQSATVNAMASVSEDASSDLPF